MQAAAQHPLIGKAYGIIKTLSYDEETRLLAQSREKALRDAKNREDGARAEALTSVAIKMLNKKYTFDQIAEVTGYSVPEVQRIAAEQSQG